MKEIDLKKIVSDIEKKKAKIVGFGYYTEGVHEYWRMLKIFLYKLVKKYSNVDIYFQDVYPLVSKLNSIINEGRRVYLNKTYNSNSKYPLKKYISNNGFDSIEFLDFINSLHELNSEGNDIKIFGVKKVLEDTEYDQYQLYDHMQELENFYPKFAKNDTKHSLFIKSIIDLNENEYMFNFIDYLQQTRKRLGIVVGHVDNIQKFKLGSYHTAGHLLSKKYDEKYIAIGTASMGGIVRFVGRIKPNKQRNNTKIYEKVKYDKQPIGYKITDNGSLQRIVSNRYPRKPYHVFKIENNNSLYYYISDKYKFSEDINEYYRNIKHLDYLIYFEKSTPIHNIIFNESVYI